MFVRLICTTHIYEYTVILLTPYKATVKYMLKITQNSRRMESNLENIKSTNNNLFLKNTRTKLPNGNSLRF